MKEQYCHRGHENRKINEKNDDMFILKQAQLGYVFWNSQLVHRVKVLVGAIKPKISRDNIRGGRSHKPIYTRKNQMLKKWARNDQTGKH